MKRVAICFYGQSRTFEICSELNKKWFLDLESKYKVDYFIHTWNSNTGGGTDNHFVEIDNIEKLSHTLPITNIQVEKVKEFLWKDRRPEEHPETLRHYCMLYSMSKSLGLRKAYEKVNNFRYDYVILLRMDEFFCRGFYLNFENYMYENNQLSTIDACFFPENYNDSCVVDRHEAVIRDEGFGMNSQTADIFQKIYGWYIASCVTSQHSLNQGEKTNSVLVRGIANCPEGIIARFIVDKGLHLSNVPVCRDCKRIIVRDVKDLESKKNLIYRELYIRLLEEVYMIVDLDTKESKWYNDYVSFRLSGYSIKQSLIELVKEGFVSSIDEQYLVWSTNSIDEDIRCYLTK